MFHCLWLHAPREHPLATRLYRRTYGRTYGRRALETEQPLAMPANLHLSESAAPAQVAAAGIDRDGSFGRAA